jgi:hypothetical protein
VIKAVDMEGKVSHTSRTVGKWTRLFEQGISTFSIPLEPLKIVTTEDYTSDMNADYIRYMDYGTHSWVKHKSGDGGINNSDMKVGEGYEVSMANQTYYTFCGLPGAMIIHDHDNGFLGFDYSTKAKDLIVSVNPAGDVNLFWQEEPGIGPSGWYDVYYSHTRDGFFGLEGSDYFYASAPLTFGTTSTTHVGADADVPGTRLYYMVVPFDGNGLRGSSTYTVGVWTEEYLAEYDTMGIPLKLDNIKSADWYCENIPDSVGINYYIRNETRWGWHSTRMPEGAFDTDIVITEGYQISTNAVTGYTFIGI